MPQQPCVVVSCPVMSFVDNTLVASMQDSYRDSPALGVYLLAAHLHRKGYPCDVLDWVASPQLSLEDVVCRLLNYEVVLLSANSLNWAIARILARKVKERNPGIKTCVGGPHPTCYPRSIIASGCFDGLFRGEADRSIHLVCEVLRSGREQEIPGFFLTRNAADKASAVQVIQEPDLTRFDWRPAYDLIPDSQYGTIPVLTSRGCRFNCTFCSTIGHRNWRSYPAQIAVEQLLYALPHCQRTRSKKINIVDNIFTADHQRILDLCKMLPEDAFRRRLTYDATIDDLRDQELLEALEPFTSDLLAGAEVISHDEARKIHKAVSPELIQQAAQNLHKYNLGQRTVFSFIIGFPWHTKENCINTLEFVTNLILDYGVRIYLQWYWPIPGSALWDELERERKIGIEVVDEPGFFRRSEWFYAVRNMSSEDVQMVDERIRPVQMLLSIRHGSPVRRPLEYSPPMI
ncbi:MAG: radical SAM protein [bacterium]